VNPIYGSTLLAHSLVSLKELAVAFLCFNSIPVPIPMTTLVPIGVPLDLMPTMISCKWPSSFSPNSASKVKWSDATEKEMEALCVNNVWDMVDLPDIAYAVSNVAYFTAKPSKQHWTTVKCIM